MDIEWNAGALAALAESAEVAAFVESAAAKVRDQARVNAAAHYPGTSRTRGIEAESGRDSQGVYSDVGYTRTHPGFVLWWSEVGTEQMSPRPHLRAALHQIRL